MFVIAIFTIRYIFISQLKEQSGFFFRDGNTSWLLLYIISMLSDFRVVSGIMWNSGISIITISGFLTVPFGFQQLRLADISHPLWHSN